MPPPLIAAVLRDPRAKAALGRLDGRLTESPSIGRLLAAEHPRPPRLFVIQLRAGEAEAAGEAVSRLRRDRPLADVLLWAPAATAAAVAELFRHGARDVVVSRSPRSLADAADAVLRQQQLLPRLDQLAARRGRSSRFESMLSRSDAMWDLFDLCARTAPADATVLIVGETGTGKELLARAVHRLSQRPGRFVAANCASLPSELINSELFGHEKGAFTGADRAKTGLVAHADAGTLFLDEVGDMPAEAQQSLLRMLQERRVRPVGSLTEQEVDVRVVAATNVPLDAAVRKGAFREDLFYRLDVIRMNVPPLRERPQDILFLFGHFVKKLARHYGLAPPTLGDSFLDAMLECRWPGNVRELENFAERLVLARSRRALAGRDFASLQSASLAAGRGSPARQAGPAAAAAAGPAVDITKSLQDNVEPLVEVQEREYLRQSLRENRGRIAATAEQAGISRRTLLRKLNRHGLDKEDYK